MKNILLIVLLLLSIVSCSKKVVPVETDAQRCARLFPYTKTDSLVNIKLDTTYQVSVDSTIHISIDTTYNDTSKTITKVIEKKIYVPQVITKVIETTYTVRDSAGYQSFRDSIVQLKVTLDKVKVENNELKVDNKVGDKKYKTLLWSAVFVILLGALLIYFLNRRR